MVMTPFWSLWLTAKMSPRSCQTLQPAWRAGRFQWKRFPHCQTTQRSKRSLLLINLRSTLVSCYVTGVTGCTVVSPNVAIFPKHSQMWIISSPRLNEKFREDLTKEKKNWAWNHVITHRVHNQLQFPHYRFNTLLDEFKEYFNLFFFPSLQLYKVTPQEEKCGSLLDAVVCRMATKDVM